jgi:hypothetical protein
MGLLAIVVGVALGVFVGAVPGLTGTMLIALIVPLTYQDRLVGLIELHHCQLQPHEWSEDDTVLVDAIAAQLSVAIIQAEAYTNLQDLNQQLAASAAQAGVHFFADGAFAFEGHRLCEDGDRVINLIGLQPTDGPLLDLRIEHSGVSLSHQVILQMSPCHKKPRRPQCSGQSVEGYACRYALS